MTEPGEPNHGGGAVPPPSFDLPPAGRPERSPLVQPGANARPPTPTPPPGSPPLQATVATSKPGRWKIPVAILAVLGLGAGSFVAARTVASRTSGATVHLVAADEVGSHPFTEDASSVSLDDVSILLDGTADVGVVEAAAPTDGDSSGLTPVAADRSVLYGQGAAPVCDVDALLAGLAGDDRARSVWAELMGVDGEAVEATVRSLTPLVLARDTAVTNTAYEDGEPRRFQAVLQAGTAVLVDGYGVPRVKCSCGNPLLPPDQDGDVTFEGTRWDRFDPEVVVHIEQTNTDASELSVIDLVTNERTTVALGGTTSLDGYLVDDHTGVYVVADDGTRTQVLDHPVAAVFDDGAGGLVFQHERSSGESLWGRRNTTSQRPASADEAAIWHLPAGATDAVRILESEDPTASWHSLEDVDVFDGRVAVGFARMSGPTSCDESGLCGEFTDETYGLLDLERRTSEDLHGLPLPSEGRLVVGEAVAATWYDNDHASWSWMGADRVVHDYGCTDCVIDDLVGTDFHLWLHSYDGYSLSLCQLQDDPPAACETIELSSADPPEGQYGVVSVDGRTVLVSPIDADGSAPFVYRVDVDTREVTVLDLRGRTRRLTAPVLRPLSQAVTGRQPGGTGSMTPTSEPSPSSSEIDMTGFVGGWFQHAGWLDIRSDGAVHLSIQIHDVDDPGLGSAFGEVDLRAVERTGDVLVVEAVATDTHYIPVGTRYRLVPHEYGLEMLDGPESPRQWCDDVHATEGYCGA